VTRCSTVSAVALNPAKNTDVPGSGSEASMLTPVSPKEHEKIKQAIASLHDIDTDGLPSLAIGDTVLGLRWALEAMIRPMIQPRSHHHAPFNVHISKEESALGQAVINEVFGISCLVLVGLNHFSPLGFVNPCGAEITAVWSPGDFWEVVAEAQAALKRLEALAGKLCELRYGALPKKVQATGQ